MSSTANGMSTVFQLDDALHHESGGDQEPAGDCQFDHHQTAAEPAKACRWSSTRLSSLSTAPALTRDACSDGTAAGEQAGQHDESEHEEQARGDRARRSRRTAADPTEIALVNQRMPSDAQQPSRAQRQSTANTTTSVRCCRTTRLRAGPKRHAHRHLTAPQGRPCGEKVGDVDAGDEQHADAGPEHREQQVIDLRREHVCARSGMTSTPSPAFDFTGTPFRAVRRTAA